MKISLKRGFLTVFAIFLSSLAHAGSAERGTATRSGHKAAVSEGGAAGYELLCQIWFPDKEKAEQALEKLKPSHPEAQLYPPRKSPDPFVIWVPSFALQKHSDDFRQKLSRQLESAGEGFGGEFKGCGESFPMIARKPVIYLYPPFPQDVEVRLDYRGSLIFSYPDYDPALKGWKVTAYPDGHLVNKGDGREYSYLFWEGIPDPAPLHDFSRGFIVKGEETKEFLRKALKELGLTPREYNEFIVYWLPRMQNNAYNLIHFAGESYVLTAPLEITPKPDSVLRVFMVFKGLDRPLRIEPQELKSFERKGFAVVEWGGAEITGKEAVHP